MMHYKNDTFNTNSEVVEIFEDDGVFWCEVKERHYVCADTRGECVRQAETLLDKVGWPASGVCFWGPLLGPHTFP